MLLSFCNNYREVQKLNIFSNSEGIPYIEFYLPRKNVEFKMCAEKDIPETIEKIKNNLNEDEWLSNLNIAVGEMAIISYEITKEVMYVIPIENSTHKEVKDHINNLLKNNEVIDIDKIKQELSKTKASSIAEFAENIVRRI